MVEKKEIPPKEVVVEKKVEGPTRSAYQDSLFVFFVFIMFHATNHRCAAELALKVIGPTVILAADESGAELTGLGYQLHAAMAADVVKYAHSVLFVACDQQR